MTDYFFDSSSGRKLLLWAGSTYHLDVLTSAVILRDVTVTQRSFRGQPSSKGANSTYNEACSHVNPQSPIGSNSFGLYAKLSSKDLTQAMHPERSTAAPQFNGTLHYDALTIGTQKTNCLHRRLPSYQ